MGAPGTVWTFKASSLRIRLIALGADESGLETVAGIVAQALKYLNRWTRSQQCDPDPDDPDPDPRMAYLAPDLGAGLSVSVYRAAVHATVGTYEDLEHVLHLRPKGGITPDTDETGCLALAARIAVAWAAWWNSTVDYDNSGTQPTKLFFSQHLTYDKITMSYLTFPGGNDPPDTVTPSCVYNFPSPLVGTNGTAVTLPLEVALCLTLLTDTTGPTTRGRTYLGGLGTGVLDPAAGAAIAGLFSPPLVHAIGHRFGLSVVDGIHNDAAAQGELHVVSRKNGSSRGVGGIRVGQVPDSQRRRRWHQPENPSLVWGTA